MIPGVLLLAFLLASCSKESMEIVRLDIHDSDAVASPVASTRMRISYVVSDPIANGDSLERRLLAHSRSQDPQLATQDIWVVHSYFRETRFTPRDFQETVDRNGKISAHGVDHLLDVVHARSTDMDCWFVHRKGSAQRSPLDTCTQVVSIKAPSDTSEGLR